MLRKGQLEYLADLIPNGPEHFGLKCFLRQEIRRYDCLLEEDKFVRFIAIHRCFCSGLYQFQYKDGAVEVSVPGKEFEIGLVHSQGELGELIEKNSFPELRFCDYCGSPMEEGFTDESDYLCCEEEFQLKMDSNYGAGNWRPEPTGCEDYCYEYLKNGEWIPCDWYWTEWN